MGCINVPRKGLSQSALLYGHSVLTRLKLLAKKSPSQSENRCFVTGNKILRPAGLEFCFSQCALSFVIKKQKTSGSFFKNKRPLLDQWTRSD
uniref:Uncharacterized protein n=1 Tax=Crocodylus porosus TaxID=8502 RepID=A0A7M4FMM6_CROPO